MTPVSSATPAPPRIVLVEDCADDAELVELALRRSHLDFTIACVQDRRGFEEALRERPAVILCDFHLPGFSCAEALAIAGKVAPAAAFIVVSRHVSDPEAAALVGAGATFFVRKDRLHELADAIRKSLAAAPHREPRNDPPAS